jgi:hypothetical protein
MLRAWRQIVAGDGPNGAAAERSVKEGRPIALGSTA